MEEIPVCSVCGEPREQHSQFGQCPADRRGWVGTVFTPAEGKAEARPDPRSLQKVNAMAFDKVMVDREALLSVLEAIVAFNTPLPCGLLEQARAAISAANGEKS